ncbi:stationary phase survival protein SurE [mine drainage metagenome]|uniref:5'-nucleotidase n=1 Tax=mine drainage metagenome TaxID=410659 RepID=T0YT02_9ZZZZ
MRILLTNDDGWNAPGITLLSEALKPRAEVVRVAPDRNRSGASNSLTLTDPLRVSRMAHDVFAVNGTPTDCVHLALTGLLDIEPDLVISGINDGANLGDDVLYSGTVAAAMEGRFLGLPAIAISLVDAELRPYETAVAVVGRMLDHLNSIHWPQDTILNVNVPALPIQSVKGYRATRLGHRHRASPAIRALDPRGKPIYWVGRAGPAADSGEETDFHAIYAGQISITPIEVDLTRHAALPILKQWVSGMEND